METKDKVLDLLKSTDQPMKSGEIADALNLDKKDIDKAIKSLKSEEAITSPKRCYYSAQ